MLQSFCFSSAMNFHHHLSHVDTSPFAITVSLFGPRFRRCRADRRPTWAQVQGLPPVYRSGAHFPSSIIVRVIACSSPTSGTFRISVCRRSRVVSVDLSLATTATVSVVAKSASGCVDAAASCAAASVATSARRCAALVNGPRLLTEVATTGWSFLLIAVLFSGFTVTVASVFDYMVSTVLVAITVVLAVVEDSVSFVVAAAESNSVATSSGLAVAVVSAASPSAPTPVSSSPRHRASSAATGVSSSVFVSASAGRSRCRPC
ncbi:unnamed protein product [Phytophthora fragariaefolia]|uniref:Unnamed protein product n=1 Tax=Phytophthora fragariaefolia TaxID=1490495 RepID=A0A9W6XPF7_9STRA|nr:unnamed protein product [Phytophthora fragariaefolia]